MSRDRKAHPSVLIYWDIESCPPPSWVSGYEIVAKIRAGLQHLGPVLLFKTYCEVSNSPRLSGVRAELQNSGVTVVHCPQNGQVDKMIIVDVLLSASDHPESIIVIISGDRDYSYLIAMLRLRHRRIVVVCSANAVSTQGSLMATASQVIYWETMATKRPLSVLPNDDHDADTLDLDSVTTETPSLAAEPIPPLPQAVPIDSAHASDDMIMGVGTAY